MQGNSELALQIWKRGFKEGMDMKQLPGDGIAPYQ
jgi:hypothetical protein